MKKIICLAQFVIVTLSLSASNNEVLNDKIEKTKNILVVFFLQMYY